ncbi:MAG: DUF5953 family protein [Cystobacter sp.]
MSNPPSPLVLTVYAPALADGDSRPLTVIRGMERALPGLRLESTISSEGKLIPLPSPDVPHHLGWVNYWSAAAARAIGFPDPARDAELLPHSRRTATGGWVVQLTAALLDLDNPAHLDALKGAYGRFPEIGGRSSP